MADSPEGLWGIFAVWGRWGSTVVFGGSSDCGEPAIRRQPFIHQVFTGHPPTQRGVGMGDLLAHRKRLRATQKPSPN